MSKEYVEREVISEGIRKYYYKNPPNSSYQEGFDRGLDKAQRVILDAPVADVVDVRHGRWIQPHWKNSNYCCNCSECGREAMHADYQWDKNGIYPLCPHCGAKMDGEGSMRIIKQGRPKATKNILRFRCCRCGCEFEADNTEYEQASQIAYVHDGIIATCICPCCGVTVYIP